MKNTFLIAFFLWFSTLTAVACSVYKVTKEGKTIVGNNEDYVSPNSQFWYEKGEADTYGVMYMGLLNNFAQGAINEKGLMFDGFSVPYLAINEALGKSKVPIRKVVREVMQTMSNVHEVAQYLKKIDLSSLTNSMLVFVDKEGSYLIVEGDEFIIGREAEKSFSNFYYSKTEDLKTVPLAYFQKGQSFINSSKGTASMDYCAQAMSEYAQSKLFNVTQYSTVYDLEALKVRVYLYHDYSNYIEIDVKEELAKGNHSVMIAELFPESSIGYQYYLKYNNSEQPTLFIEEALRGNSYSETELNAMDFADDINVIGYEWIKEKKRPDVAVKVFEYALRLMPNHADLYDSLGEAYYILNQWDKAIINYEESLRLAADNEHALEMLEKIRKKKEVELLTSFGELSALVDYYAKSTLSKGNINSLAIAVYKDGHSYQHYYGELVKDSSLQPTDSTLYEIASISKIFVGSLTAKAVLEKEISLEDDIRMYLPGKYPNLQFEGVPITIKNLLTHTLGLEEKTPRKLSKINKKTKQGFYESRDFTYDIGDLLQELKRSKVNRKPGTHYAYNSVGPELLAYILEQVYDASYSSLLEELLASLALTNTHLQTDDSLRKYLAPGFDESGHRAPLDKNPLLGGGYGMVSNLPDLMRFVKYQLESSDPMIKEASRLLFKEEEEGDDKGYLWDVGFGKVEGFYYGKTGTSNGVQSGILVCPDAKYGLVLIMNNTTEAALDDWIALYNRIETALINFPKINLVSLLTPEFISDFETASARYKELKGNTSHYFTSPGYFNTLGYELLQNNQFSEAIRVFSFAITEYPLNGNLYDSLGEAYFLAKDYAQAQEVFSKALALDPSNKNASDYLSRIAKILIK